MWIASTLGFYSIVEKPKKGVYQIRTRQRKDLENLMLAAELDESIDNAGGTDYQFRIYVQQDKLLKIMKILAESIEYPNFKSEVEKIPDQRDKLNGYNNLWADLFQVALDIPRRFINPSGYKKIRKI